MLNTFKNHIEFKALKNAFVISFLDAIYSILLYMYTYYLMNLNRDRVCNSSYMIICCDTNIDKM